MDIAAIRTAIATQLDTIPGLRATGTAPGQVNPPIAIVTPNTTGMFITYGETFDGAVSLAFQVYLLVSTASDRTAQALLDGYCNATGTQSVLACLQATPTLGGLVDYTAVIGAESYGNVDWNGVTYLGAIFTIQAGNP